MILKDRYCYLLSQEIDSDNLNEVNTRLETTKYSDSGYLPQNSVLSMTPQSVVIGFHILGCFKIQHIIPNHVHILLT